MSAELVELIRTELRAQADPERAPGMQAYMKSSMPYLGVQVPNVRRLTRAAALRYPPADLEGLRQSAAALWREAEFREERYAATELTGLRMATGRLELLGLWREMIVTGAWWDHVDAVAHRIGDLLVAHRDDNMVGMMQGLVQQENNNSVRLKLEKALRDMNASPGRF